MDYRAAILLYVELLFALVLLWRAGLLKNRKSRLIAVLAAAGAFLIRYLCLDHETLDYQGWISVWIQALADAGPWKGLGQEVWSCNYNVPYLYFLAFFTGGRLYNLYWIKLLSILFDVLLAWFSLLLVGRFTNSPAKKLTVFLGTLWLPTVILNGAYWGQCDSIYSAFAVLSLYLALADRPGWSVAAIAVSISFKLQGIFLLPVFLVFLFAGKMKIRHLFVFPVAYIATLLPAVIAGRNFWELLTFYVKNASSIGSGLNYNSPSIYALFDFSRMTETAAADIGIVLAFGFCALVYLWMLLHYGSIPDRALLSLAVVFCIGVPLLLPHMHDRYFFLSDVLTLALAVVSPELFFVPVLASFASLLCYHAYLRGTFLLPLRWGCLALIVCLLTVLIDTARRLPRLKKSS